MVVAYFGTALQGPPDVSTLLEFDLGCGPLYEFDLGCGPL